MSTARQLGGIGEASQAGAPGSKARRLFIVAVTFASLAGSWGASPTWAAAGRTPACESPPCLVPLLLQDAEETERFVEGFPSADYERHMVPRPPWACPLRGLAQCISIWWRTPFIGRFHIEPPPRDPIKGNLANGLVWEPHVVRSLQEHVVPGSVALDIGAYIGTHAMLMGRLAGPESRVYAFEPQRKLHRELRRNIDLNGLANVTALKYVIGAALGEGGVAVGTGGERVEMRTLDSFGFQNVSLVKIDVEGFENEVLAGAERLLRENRPVILIEILGGATYPGVSTRGFAPPAGPEELAVIHATWRTLDA